jgi:type IV pilus assembly protein PilF
MRAARLGIMGAAMLAIASCISTTSNVAPEPDSGAAAQGYYQVGARYFHNGNYERARDRLKRAVELDADLAIAHSVLALSYEQLDNDRLAAEHHQKAIRAEPENFSVRNAYAVFLCGQERYEEAMAQFERAAGVPENDDAEVTLTNAGVCMSNKPDYARAESLLRQALKKKPGYGEALVQLSLLMYKTEEFLQARAFVERYLATNRATPEVLFLAVQIERSLGNDRARTDYENQLLREFPNSVQARRVLQAS